MDEAETQRIEPAEREQQPEAKRPPQEPEGLREEDGDRAAVAEAQPLASLDQPVAYVSLGLTVGDGFKFGCGMVMALVIAGLVGLLLVSAFFLVASLLGLTFPIGPS